MMPDQRFPPEQCGRQSDTSQWENSTESGCKTSSSSEEV